MSVINTNVTSVIAQKNLTSSKSSLTTAMERLSSGLRINSAKDDAAGQAVANRMTAQVKGLAQAQRNANDGISVAQTAEGALNQINDNLQRVRELAVQAQNSTNSEDDLGSIQNEIGQRLAEINRVSEETSFNGVKVLASDQELSIQVGAEDGQTIKINLGKINAESLGLANFNVDGKAEIANKAATLDDLKLASNVSEVTPDEQYTLKQDNTAVTAADLLGRLTNGQTVALQDDGGDVAVTTASTTGFASGTITGTFTSDGKGNFSYNVTSFAEADLEDYITGTASGPTAATYTLAAGGSQDILIDSTGNITDTDGNQLYLTTQGELSLNDGGGTIVAADAAGLAAAIADETGGAATLAIAGGPTIQSDGGATNTVTVTGAKLTAEELSTIAKDNGKELETAAIQVDGENVVIRSNGTVENKTSQDKIYADADNALTSSATTDTTLFVRDNGKVTDTNGEQYFVGQDGKLTTDETTKGTKTEDPLATLDDALKMVDSLRSDLGAVQNRFESAITNLSTNETNLTAARSRIQDADYAVEVGNMTRAQILQQAGTSVLAQANQLPQGVLSLLR